MMTTIIYAHPYDKSFNHAVLEEVKKQLDEKGAPYKVLDLYADGFNPVLDAASLRLYSRGETADPLAESYLDTLMHTDELVMIFPVWWGMMPAIVKGFFDKVMLTGKAYTYSAEGQLVPDKINIKRTVMLTTSQSPTELFSSFFSGYLREKVLESVGMRNLEWHNCEQTAHGPAENRANFLSLIATLF